MAGNNKKMAELSLMELKEAVARRGLDKTGDRIILMSKLRKALLEEGKDPSEPISFSGTNSQGTKTMAKEESAEDPTLSSNSANLNEGANGETVEEEETFVKRDWKGNAEIKRVVKPDRCVLWISGLVQTYLSADLKKLLSEFGTVIAVKIVASAKDPTTRFGQVSMSSPAEASLCIEKLNNRLLFGHRITVQLKCERESTKPPAAAAAVAERRSRSPSPPVLAVWVKDLPPDAKATDLKALFIDHATVTGAKVVATSKEPGAKRHGVVTLSSAEEVDHCIKTLSGTSINGHTVTVVKKVKKRASVVAGPPVLTVWVKDLPSDAKATDLKALFIDHATVTGAKVVATSKEPGAKRHGVVTLSSAEEVDHCIKTLSGTSINGHTVTVVKGKSDNRSKSKTAISPKKAAPVQRANFAPPQRPVFRGAMSGRGGGRGFARGAAMFSRGARGGAMVGGRGGGMRGRGRGFEGGYRPDITARGVFEEIVRERRALEDDMNIARRQREDQMRMKRGMREEEEDTFDPRDRDMDRRHRPEQWQSGPPMRRRGGMMGRGYMESGEGGNEAEVEYGGVDPPQSGSRWAEQRGHSDYNMVEQEQYGESMYAEEDVTYDAGGYQGKDGYYQDDDGGYKSRDGYQDDDNGYQGMDGYYQRDDDGYQGGDGYEDARSRGGYVGRGGPVQRGRGGFSGRGEGRGQAPGRGLARGGRGVTRGSPRGGGGVTVRGRGSGSEYMGQGQSRPPMRGQGHSVGMGRGQGGQGSWDEGQRNVSPEWTAKFNDKSEWRPFPASNQAGAGAGSHSQQRQPAQAVTYEFDRYTAELGRPNQHGGRQGNAYSSGTNQSSSYQLSPSAGQISGRNVGGGVPHGGASMQRSPMNRVSYVSTGERERPYGTSGGYGEQGNGTDHQWVSGGSLATGGSSAYKSAEPSGGYSGFDDGNSGNWKSSSYDTYGQTTGGNNSTASYNNWY